VKCDVSNRFSTNPELHQQQRGLPGQSEVVGKLRCWPTWRTRGAGYVFGAPTWPLGCAVLGYVSSLFPLLQFTRAPSSTRLPALARARARRVSVLASRRAAGGRALATPPRTHSAIAVLPRGRMAPRNRICSFEDGDWDRGRARGAGGNVTSLKVRAPPRDGTDCGRVDPYVCISACTGASLTHH
jgi:hypothetical protein